MEEVDKAIEVYKPDSWKSYTIGGPLAHLEIPLVAPLGDANSVVKQQIFAGNAARFYKIKLKAADNTKMPAYSEDRLTALKKEYASAAKEPSNLRYGYVRAA
jgi:hypothetical protein